MGEQLVDRVCTPRVHPTGHTRLHGESIRPRTHAYTQVHPTAHMQKKKVHPTAHTRLAPVVYGAVALKSCVRPVARARTGLPNRCRSAELLFLPKPRIRHAYEARLSRGHGLLTDASAELLFLAQDALAELLFLTRGLGSATVTRTPSLTSSRESGGGGTNPCDAGLDLSGSWQQGHSATYNAPSRFKSSAKDSARRPLGRELRGGPPRRVGRAGWANGTGPWGANALMWVGASGGHRRRLLAWILT